MSVVPFDPAALVDMVGDDPALLRRLLAQCVAQTRAAWPELVRAAAAGDHAALARQAHSMKGSIALVGAADVAALLGAIEKTAQEGRRVDGKDFAACRVAVFALLDAIDAYVGGEVTA